MGKMKKQEEKDVDTMLATTKYLTQESELTVSMRKYTKERRAKGTPISPKDKRDALEALRRMGVVDEDGRQKEKIVSWE